MAAQLGQRRVATLSVTEAVLVWALRYAIPEKAVPKHLLPTFAELFGHTAANRAAAQFSAIVTQVLTHGRAPFRGRPLDDHLVSNHERHLLTMVGAFQHADPGRGRALARWLVNDDAVDSLAASAAEIAALLCAANRILPGVAKREPVQCDSCHDTAETIPAGPPYRMVALEESEAVVVVGVRLWVSCLRMQEQPTAVLRRFLATYDAADIRADLSAFMEVLALAAKRMIDVSCTCSSLLTNDEVAILHAMGGLQRGVEPPARALAEAWFAPSHVDQAIDSLREVAGGFLRAGMILPVIDRRAPERTTFGAVEDFQTERAPTIH